MVEISRDLQARLGRCEEVLAMHIQLNGDGLLAPSMVPQSVASPAHVSATPSPPVRVVHEATTAPLVPACVPPMSVEHEAATAPLVPASVQPTWVVREATTEPVVVAEEAPSAATAILVYDTHSDRSEAEESSSRAYWTPSETARFDLLRSQKRSMASIARELGKTEVQCVNKAKNAKRKRQ